MPSTPATIARRAVLAALASAAFGAYAAGPTFSYEVTVTNISANQRFTPLLVATHKPDIRLFRLGEAAGPALATLAEQGNVAPLRAALDASPLVRATAAGDGLLDPGQTVSFVIQGNPREDRLSLAAMLIPTNDAFMALNAVPLPLGPNAVVSMRALAYDAGSEVNDELCASIPGPFFAECGGPGGGAQAGGGEGFVHVHRGMHGVGDFAPAVGDFAPAVRDWRNPVAAVQVRRMR